jgi:hypothetical protein
LGLLAILIALGGYLYFVESRRTPGDEAARKNKVFSVEADKIEEVTVRSESGDTTTLKKNGTEWQIAAPAAMGADAAEISGITTNLSSLQEERVIDENPGDLKDFGLGQPRIQVAFKAGGEDHQLLIGSKTPTGSDLYAKTSAGPKVFLIASYLESTFNRSTFDLRDKTALQFNRDTADAIEITTADRALKFAKRSGNWELTEPAVPRSDSAAIEGLLFKLNGLQMKSVAAADAADLAKYGLDKPAASVRIGSGSSQATLLLGSKAEEATIYAKDGSRPAVFTVEATLLDDLKKDAGEYRQKDLFDARAFNTSRIEVVRGGATTVFEKRTVKDKDGRDQQQWKQTAPSAKDVDGATVDSLLSSLTSARADSFVDKAPADAKTEAVFALTFEEGKKQERVTFMKAGSDAYAVRDGSAGAAKLSASTVDEILKSLDSSK